MDVRSYGARLLSVALLGAAFGLLWTSVAAAAPKRVAVLPITNSAGLPSKQVHFLTRVVRQEGINALSSQAFQILTQANLEALLPPGKTLADCIDQCAIKTGRNLKAHYVVTGQLQRAMGSYRLALSLYGTQSGRYLEGLTIGAPDILKLEAAIQARAPALYAAVRTDAQGSRFAVGGLGAIVVETKPPRAITMSKRRTNHEFVAFTSAPFGAKVMLNGRQLCETPCQRIVPRGTHTVSLAHPCFETSQTSLEVGAGRLEQRGGAVAEDAGPTRASVQIPGGGPLELRFRARSTQVRVDIEVDDKTARVGQVSDGRRVVSIPLSNGRGQLSYTLSHCAIEPSARDMSERSRVLTVSVDGHVPVEKTFPVNRPAMDTWAVKVRSMPEVTVQCSTSTATLYEGDERIGVGRVKLSRIPGNYRFSCGFPNADESSQRIRLQAGDKTTVSLKAASLGALTLKCAGQMPELYFGARVDRGFEVRLGNFNSSEVHKTVSLELTPGQYDAYCATPGGTFEHRAVKVLEGADESISLSSVDVIDACRRREIWKGAGWLSGGALLIGAGVGLGEGGLALAVVGLYMVVGAPVIWWRAHRVNSPCRTETVPTGFDTDDAKRKWSARYLSFVRDSPRFMGSQGALPKKPRRDPMTSTRSAAAGVTQARLSDEIDAARRENDWERLNDALERYARAESKRSVSVAGSDNVRPETGVRAAEYNVRAWGALMVGDGWTAEQAIQKGVALDPDNAYLHTNLAHAYLFIGRYSQAKKILEAWSPRPFDADKRYPTYRDAFLDDYRTFEEKGVVPEEHRAMFRFFHERLKRGTFDE